MACLWDWFSTLYSGTVSEEFELITKLELSMFNRSTNTGSQYQRFMVSIREIGPQTKLMVYHAVAGQSYRLGLKVGS